MIKKANKKIDKSPSFYKNYPNLFVKYFNEISKEQINILSKAGYHYYHSVLYLDNIIDDRNFENIAKMISLQEESIKMLSSIYGIDSPFWTFWNKRKKEYFEAVEIEKSLTYVNEINFEVYENLADKKSAFGKIAIDSLFCLDRKQDDDLYQKLLLSHKYFSIGFQLYDDVKDFKEDFDKGQFNFAIYKLKNIVNFQQYKEDVNILNKLLFIKQIGQEILIKSIEQFDKAISILESLKTQSKWLETVIEMKNTIINYLDITNGYLATLQAKIKLKNQKKKSFSFFEYQTINDSVIKKGLNFIKSDYLQNCVNLKHIMYLSQKEGFENISQIHISDTFQRALVNDCFITIANNYNLDISKFLKRECEYLISLRNKDKIGGWSYFPTVQEIAPDIDDLGQIIQLFVLSKNQQFVDDYCNNAIITSLNERMLNNGGIETWIIPIKNQSAIQKKQEYFNSTKWGKGPDVEVVANFAYSLAILNKEKYYDIIKKAITYIIEQQDNKGYWSSRWYYGNYYGTYICLKLLKIYEKDYSTEIEKALDFLTSNQNKDGGFSIDKNSSTALTSALAILGLKLFFDKNHKIIEKATMFLINSQGKDGSWEAENFIKPKTNEPYKSEVLTTAYVLKSLCL